MARLSSVSRPTCPSPSVAQQRCRLSSAPSILLVVRIVADAAVGGHPCADGRPSRLGGFELGGGVRRRVRRPRRAMLSVQGERGVYAGDGALRGGDLYELQARRDVACGIETGDVGLAVAVDGD